MIEDDDECTMIKRANTEVRRPLKEIGEMPKQMPNEQVEINNGTPNHLYDYSEVSISIDEIKVVEKENDEIRELETQLKEIEQTMNKELRMKIRQISKFKIQMSEA